MSDSVDIKKFVSEFVGPKFYELINDVLSEKKAREVEHFRLVQAKSKIKKLTEENERLEKENLELQNKTSRRKAPPLPISAAPPPSIVGQANNNLILRLKEEQEKNDKSDKEIKRLRQEVNKLKQATVSSEVEETARAIHETNIQLKSQIMSLQEERGSLQKRIDSLRRDASQYAELSDLYREPRNNHELSRQLQKLPKYLLDIFTDLYNANQKLTENENSNTNHDNLLQEIQEKDQKIKAMEEEMYTTNEQLHLLVKMQQDYAHLYQMIFQNESS